MSKSVLAIGAHPDDIEIFMGGTFLLLGKAGFDLHYLSIANGSGGTTVLDIATIATQRREEARRAAARAGATFHESLVNDLEVVYERRLLGRVGSVVREVAPDILLVHAPDCYVEDHVNAARLSVSAAFGRSMRNFVVSPPRPLTRESISVYHAQPHLNRDQLRRFVRPEIYVDISSVLEEKLAMLREHATQGMWLGESQGMKSYLETFKEAARQLGGVSGRFEFAEGWRRHHHAGFCEEDADPLTEALAPGGTCFVNEAYRKSLGP
jgi:LmbE family N-acetylglucosaminyl deacetylase